MFNQNNYRKRTKKISKERIDWYELVKVQKEQRRINGYQNRINNRQEIFNTYVTERITALENELHKRKGFFALLKAFFFK